VFAWSDSNVPMIREAMLVAKRVFAEIRAEGGA